MPMIHGRNYSVIQSSDLPWRFTVRPLALGGLLLFATACGQRHDDSAQDRLSLARRYVALSHRADRVGLAYRKQLALLWEPHCQTQACKNELDGAIQRAVMKVEHARDEQAAEIIAAHVTTHDLLAATSFAKSAEGQALMRAQVAIADGAARMQVAILRQVDGRIAQEFCPANADVCAKLGLKLPQPRSAATR